MTVLVAAVILILTGCVPAMISGRINTATYNQLPAKASFTVLARQLSLTDRKIASLIDDKLTALGYQKADSASDATLAVLFRYSVDSGNTRVSSSPDFVFGGQRVASHVQYARFFEIVIIDLQKSDVPNKLEITWQGELRISGSGNDMSRLAPVFIDAIFESYGKSVTDQRFSTKAP